MNHVLRETLAHWQKNGYFLYIHIKYLAHTNNSIHMNTIVRMIAFMNTIVRMRKSMNTILPLGEKIKNSLRF